MNGKAELTLKNGYESNSFNVANDAEVPLIEGLFLVGHELPHAVGWFHRAASELDDRDGEAVQVKDDIGAPAVAPLQGQLLGQHDVVFLGTHPVDQVYRFVRLACNHVGVGIAPFLLVGASATTQFRVVRSRRGLSVIE